MCFRNELFVYMSGIATVKLCLVVVFFSSLFFSVPREGLLRDCRLSWVTLFIICTWWRVGRSSWSPSGLRFGQVPWTLVPQSVEEEGVRVFVLQNGNYVLFRVLCTSLYVLWCSRKIYERNWSLEYSRGHAVRRVFLASGHNNIDR